MLIFDPLPASLGHAGHFTAEGNFTQLVATQTEFTENTTRTAGLLAAITLTARLELRGSCCSFRRATMRSSSDSLALLICSNRAARLAANFATVFARFSSRLIRTVSP